MNLYVGGIPFSFNDGDLERLFSTHGTVSSAQVILDRDTGRSRGFGFVEMPNDDEARTAIQELEGSSAGGRRITVNEARPRSGGAGPGHATAVAGALGVADLAGATRTAARPAGWTTRPNISAVRTARDHPRWVPF